MSGITEGGLWSSTSLNYNMVVTTADNFVMPLPFFREINYIQLKKINALYKYISHFCVWNVGKAGL